MKKILMILIHCIYIFITFSCQQTESFINVTEVIHYPKGTIQMVIVPDINNFNMGWTGLAEPVHRIDSISSFRIGKYEVTYDQWYTIRVWANANGYTFSNQGREGDDGIISAPPTGSGKNEPVTRISWRDAIVWCNAASEYDGLCPVYFTDAGLTIPLKQSTSSHSFDASTGSQDNPYVNWSANGYRLPTEAEWEAAARYNNSIWTDGHCASGSTVHFSDVTTSNVAWYSSSHPPGTKSIGTKDANHLAIYDMSGNVWEWCWDFYGLYTVSSPYTGINPKGPSLGTRRIFRGGGWNNSAEYMQVCLRASNFPYSQDSNKGLRVARSE